MSKNNIGTDNTGYFNSGNYNSGDRNSGDRNSGYFNSGNRNSGDYNSGDYNSGDRNSGDYNSGDYNSGDYNSGNYNSGNYNSGNYNSGNRNSGNRNSGNYNSGNYNSGMFNTDEPKMRIFNKESDLTYTEFRTKFGYKDLNLPICLWIEKDDMTEDEKKNITGWSEMGGYLKTLTYKEAWQKTWNKVSQEVKDWYKNLPNFDKEIFFSITGIDIKNEGLKVGDVIEICKNGQKFKAKIC